MATITRLMQRNTDAILQKMLTRADFEVKLKQLQEAAPSARPSVRSELLKMLSAWNIAYDDGVQRSTEEDIAYLETLIRDAKLPEQAETQILELLFDCFENYPTPEEYMLRIVNHLCCKEDGWQDDTLRLRILKQFIKYGNYLVYQNDKKDADGNTIRDAKGNPKKATVRLYGGDCYIKAYIKEKIGNRQPTTEEVLAHLDDAIFDVLKTASKEQKKPDGVYGLLKLAGDLAQGAFKTGGATKRELYLFAIVYHMTYAIPDRQPQDPMVLHDPNTTDSIRHYESDIEKNLFRDYYNNNLMRFLTEAYEKNLGAFELDPSGQGINYKNFAEMVYIYYISTSYAPTDKIKLANEMITRLANRPVGKALPECDTGMTKYYSDLFTEEILAKSEDEFEAFVADNYDCNLTVREKNQKGVQTENRKGIFQIQTAQQTAFDLYNDIIALMQSLDVDFTRNRCNYGLWFTDVSMIEKTKGASMQAFRKGKDAKKVDNFIKLLYSINMFMGHLFAENETDPTKADQHTAPSVSPIKAMTVSKPEQMTRTTLMIAYYYCYNAQYTSKLSGNTMSFADVYNDYTNCSGTLADDWRKEYHDCLPGLNLFLQKAGYQLISDKNIFDIALIFSSYAYLTN